jgi:crotonobetainyl-CoA:carnitine CoA-transferase CaiB-like acyl-CoA transferase
MGTSMESSDTQRVAAGTGSANGPLQGVRVIDMTSIMMGPFATQILADYGADVLKVETLDGDGVRGVGPMRHPAMGPLYLHANRNKRSIAVDLKRSEGREILLKLLTRADVLVFNVRPHAMARLGLSYDEIREVNPSIIYVGGVGFGSNGPYAGRPAYDDLIQGLSGLAALGVRAGADEPRYAPSVIADRITGLSIANAVLSALYHRSRTGEGQRVEVPMFETMVQLVLGDHFGGRTFEPPLGEMGYPRLLSRYRRPYATKDGYICVVVYTDSHWRAFFDLIGMRDTFDADKRFADIGSRTKHIDELYELVAENLLTRATAEWLSLLEKADIPAMPMHTPESLLNDPHLVAVRFFEEVEHPTEGRLVQMRVPSEWSTAQRTSHTPAPRLGEHTRDVLRTIGYSDDVIASWIQRGIVVDDGTPVQ